MFYRDKTTTCDNNQLVYEYPPPKYSAERLFEILFDPDIPYNKVCKEKPSGIRCSAVDAGYLKFIDDIKKDEFGIWNYSGSHPVAYSVHADNGHMVIEKQVLLEKAFTIYDVYIALIHQIQRLRG